MEGKRERDTGFFVAPDENVSLAWSWALEALADSKEVDLSLLRALVSRVPDFESELFRSAKERISSRLSASGPCEDVVLPLSKEASKKTTAVPALSPMIKVEPIEQSDQQSLPDGGIAETLVSGKMRFDSGNIKFLEWHTTTAAPVCNSNSLRSARKTQDHKCAWCDVCAAERSHGKDDTVPETSTSSGEVRANGRICSIPHLLGPSVTGSARRVSSKGRFCAKCSKDGNLLCCDTLGCPTSVHESCLGSPVNFDDHGNFYCPYCAYKKTKEKALLARKALLRFMGKDLVNNQGKRRLKRKARYGNHEEALEDAGFDKHDDDKQQRRDAPNESRALVIYHDARPAFEGEDNHRDDQFRFISYSGCRNAVVFPNQNQPLHHVGGMVQTAIEILSSDKHKESSRRLDKQHAHRRSPCEGRKKIPWTKEEEEALKEGVRRFPDVGYGIQWTKILEYGRLVYHNTRTTLDLKNRWRCIQLRVRSDQP